MRPIRIAEIVKAVSGTLRWGDEDAVVTSVVTDSREVKEGSLFVPIIGEKVDAHRFIPEVLDSGASCVFSSDFDICEKTGAGIYVEDTLKALQDFAMWYRCQFSIPVIGITGSVGKTTTKEMIGAVLEQKYKTVKTIGNLNSQIGLSLMMFHLEEDTQIGIFEMGISMPGEMDRLVEIAKPSIAVMTNIGVSHIGNLGSRENICREKSKIVRYLQEKDAFYVCGNGDLREMVKDSENFQTYYYGTEKDCLYYGDNIQINENGQSFVFHSEKGEEEIALSVMGLHNVNNAIVALALALSFGVPMEQAKKALANYKPIAMRGVIKEAKGAHIIDDTYNASPDSIKSNLHALLDYPKTGKKVAVLADVLELGEDSKKLHEEIGKYICEEAAKGRELTLLITFGKEAKYIHEYVKKSGGISAYYCETKEETIQMVKDNMEVGDWILVKGSRGMHMDEVVEAVIKE